MEIQAKPSQWRQELKNPPTKYTSKSTSHIRHHDEKNTAPPKTVSSRRVGHPSRMLSTGRLPSMTSPSRARPPTTPERPTRDLDAPVGYQRRRGVRQPLAPDAGAPNAVDHSETEAPHRREQLVDPASAASPAASLPSHPPTYSDALVSYSKAEPCPASSPDAPPPASGPAPRSRRLHAPPARRPPSAGRTP